MLIRDRIKELRRVAAKDLRPNPKNWRTHPEAQADALRGVLAEVGIADAVLARECDDGTLMLLDGHLRATVAPDATLPVLVLDVTQEEGDKILATLDPLAAMAKSDAAKLSALLAEVETGSKALDALLGDLADQAQALGGTDGVIEDQAPLPPDEATTKPGDLWILGDHRLLCGDSSKPADLDRLLGGALIQLVNSDPPYNVKVEPRSNNAIASGSRCLAAPSQQSLVPNHQGFDLARDRKKAKRTTEKMRPKDRPLANDFVSDDHFDKLLSAWFGNMARVLEPGRAFYIWGGWTNLANYPAALAAAGLFWHQQLIWVKNQPVLCRKDFMLMHEWCFYGWREGAAHVYLGPSNATDIWNVTKVPSQKMVHLTEKPVELAVRAMQYSSRPGENVLDLFGGSGSTLMGAEQTGRKAFLMELDALYCDVIVQRWETFTSRKAERVSA